MAEQKPDPTLANYNSLTPTQQALVGDVIARLRRPVQPTVHAATLPFSPDFIRVFGEALQLHHTTSERHLSKENFEYAMVRMTKLIGSAAKFGPRGQAGYDVELAGETYSLKTQADRAIKRSVINISKYMELGKGTWTDEASLGVLRDGFLKHLDRTQRILTLRYFRVPPDRNLSATRHEYELVEIPKALLKEAASGVITMRHKSKQTPKPGYCRVYDTTGAEKFALYFDGGTERKLQIKALAMWHCHPIATWVFDA